jgi:flagellin
MSRINTNIQALLAARVFNQQNARLSQSLERLSTGFRINSGRDDPAGLIASETMRAEKASINAAIENARAADNMVAVVEGSLQEVSSLLLEITDLVGTTANEAALSPDEVAANQLQIDAILESIDRIANTTQFKGRKVLNGTFDYVVSGQTSDIINIQVNGARIPNGGTRNVVVEVTQSAQAGQLVYAGETVGAAVTIRVAGNKGVEQFSFASGTAAADIATAINQSTELTGVSAYVSGTGGSTRILLDSTAYGSDQFVTVEALSGTFAVTGDDGNTTDHGQDVGALVNGVVANTSGLEASVRSVGLSLELILDSSFAQTVGSTSSFVITGGGADFSLAPDISLAGMESIGVGAMDSGNLGNALVGTLSTLKSGGTNDLNSKNFSTAQDILDAATKQVASLRGRLGAFQANTLQTTVNSLQVAFENVSAAESAIRETDFAEETSNLTRSQILVNAATAVLQIANALPQNVLALLG